MTTDAAAMPPRLARAMASWQHWVDAGVVLVPIRHHSPGCALALEALLDGLNPATVLIEGPHEYAALLGALSDERTRPPVAVVSNGDNGTAFYPLADYSPEWVALRWAAHAKAITAFIDQSYQVRTVEDDSPVLQTLQAERYLARSQAIAALAAELGCRDHDEVWEHLFEVRTAFTDWRDFFAGVFAWGALARLDVERAALDGDGTHAREAIMATLLDRHRQANAGPLVVVTGAFHTLALLDCLDDTPEATWVRSHKVKGLDQQHPAWLIRYDFARLDALRGYGAGMPAPGLWQRMWQARQAGRSPREFAVDILTEIAAALRERDEPLGTASVVAAAEHTLRLAALRGRAWPGRTDLLDSLTSTLVKGDTDSTSTLQVAIGTVFGGTQLGEVPPGIAAPPLVEEARSEAVRLRFNVTDAEPHTATLDTHRKPAHRVRREFLARMAFLGTRFARHVGGFDLMTGLGGGTLHEKWEYAWSPLVEAALVDASAEAPTLAGLVAVRLQARLAKVTTASQAARLVAETVVIGERDYLPSALGVVARYYETEASFGEAVASLHRLVGLLEAGPRVDLGEHRDAVLATVAAGLGAVAGLIPELAGLVSEQQSQACQALISLRTLLNRLETLADQGFQTEGTRRALRRLRQSSTTPPQLRGCLVGLAWADRELDVAELANVTADQLGAGADPEQVAAFLVGLMQASPEILIHTPELLAAVNERLTELPEDTFWAMLPDLRQAFTVLRPADTHRLAEAIAALTGVAAADLDALWTVNPHQVAEAEAIEKALVAGLIRDGLARWTS